MKRALATAVLILAGILAAFGQTPPNLPSNTVWGNLSPVTGPSRAVSISSLKAAMLAGERTIADTNYTIGSTSGDINLSVFVYTSLSAARTVTLLPAANYLPGSIIYLIDRSGSATGTNSISLAPTGADNINGANATFRAISFAYAGVIAESDGVSKWTVIQNNIFVRTKLPTGTTNFYANSSATGCTGGVPCSDNNDGLTPGAAKKTVLGAVYGILNNYDFTCTVNGQSQAKVNLLADEINAGASLHFGPHDFPGACAGGSVLVDGGGFTYQYDSGGSAAIAPFFSVPFVLQNVTIANSLGPCVSLFEKADMRFGAGIVWGNCAIGLAAAGGSTAVFLNNFTIATNTVVTAFIDTAENSVVSFGSGLTATCTGSPTYTWTAVAQGGSNINLGSLAWSGCGGVTAAKYIVTDGASITNGAASLPGTGGSTSSGGTVDGAAVAITAGGTGASTQQGALNNIAPTATRAGDIIYWNGSNWTHLAGNNSGSLYLSENSSGVPSWIAAIGSGVPQNNLNTQSGDYTIQTSDCGNTINETGAFKTITLPAVAGFASNCVLAVYNASSTRGQKLSGFPGAVAASPTNILWPNDTITVEIVNGAWSIQSYVNRHKLTASITVFVDNTNGNDANDCLAATTSACKTRQGALNYINTWDGNAQAITISVAAGTYTNNATQNGPFHGNPTVTMTGDTTTPSNVLISTTSADGLDLTNGASMTIGGFKFVTTTGGSAISVTNASFLNITGKMEYGTTVATHINASAASTITISADYTISGNAANHWVSTNGAVIQNSGTPTITLTGTPAFTQFMLAIGGVITPGFTFSGSATGTQYIVALNGIINNAATIPGTATTGIVRSGGQTVTPGTPGVSSCGTSPGTATGTDFSGHVTEGTTATGCTITFTTASTFTACTVSLSTGNAVGITTLGSTLVVTHASLSNNVLYWTCTN